MGVYVFIGSNTTVFNLAGCSMIIAPLKDIAANNEAKYPWSYWGNDTIKIKLCKDNSYG